MRTRSGLILALLMVAATTPARAEIPLSVRAVGGLGPGGGYHRNQRVTGSFGFRAVDLAWRQRPGRAVVLSGEVAGRQESDVEPLRPEFDSVEHRAVVLGMELTRPGASIGPYLQGGIGWGRVTADAYPRGSVSDGLTISGGAGLLLVPNPSPLGLVLGVRTSNVLTPVARSHMIAMTLGLTLRLR